MHLLFFPASCSRSLHTQCPVIKLSHKGEVHDLYIRLFSRKLEKSSVVSFVRLITLREQLLIGIWGSQNMNHTRRKETICVVLHGKQTGVRFNHGKDWE